VNRKYTPNVDRRRQLSPGFLEDALDEVSSCSYNEWEIDEKVKTLAFSPFIYGILLFDWYFSPWRPQTLF